jgi:ubiquinol-cytochrome c reductase core subunit 2
MENRLGADGHIEQTTERRSTLRIQRESELLGSALQSYHSRENLVIGAKFLRDDLPYFVELLAEVASQTKYTRAHATGHYNIETCGS